MRFNKSMVAGVCFLSFGSVSGANMPNELMPISMLTAPAAEPFDVTLGWSWEQEPADAGTNGGKAVAFNVHWGPASRFYTNSSLVSNTQAVVTLYSGAEYHLAVTAISDLGLESDYSQELVIRDEPPFTNWITTITCTLQVTNSALPAKFYLLFESDDLRTWKPALDAAATCTKTNW